MSGQLNVRYCIVSVLGWWQGFGPVCRWGSPFTAENFESPVEALRAFGADNGPLRVHVATVITNVPETPL